MTNSKHRNYDRQAVRTTTDSRFQGTHTLRIARTSSATRGLPERSRRGRDPKGLHFVPPVTTFPALSVTF